MKKKQAEAPATTNQEAAAAPICREWLEAGNLRFVCQKPHGHDDAHFIGFGSEQITAELAWVRRPPVAKKSARKTAKAVKQPKARKKT